MPNHLTTPTQSAEGRFWDWFQRNEDRLFDFDKNAESLVGEIVRELRRIHHSLSCEVSSNLNGRREIIISADGKKDAFPAVVKVADAAPSLARWDVIKFRPRRTEPCIIGIGDASLSSAEVQFTLEPEGSKIGVTLYFGDSNDLDEEAAGYIGFLLLDYALGEYDVETLVGSVQFEPQDTVSRLEKRFLVDLPAAFDALVRLRAN